MKKLIALSAAICLLITMIAGFNIFAADHTYYDMDFDNINLSIGADTEEVAAVFNNATGLTLASLTGDSYIATVNATDVDETWTGRGKILQMSGTNGNLMITVPFAGYTYDTDRLVLEFDVFIPSGATGKYSLLSTGNYNSYAKSSTAGYTNNLVMDEYTQRSADDIINDKNGGVGRVGYYGKPLGNWQHIKKVIDGKDKNAITVGGTSYTDLRTMTYSQTLISTGSTETTRVAIGNLYSGNLKLGGRPDNNAFTGTVYIDNLQIYTKAKFAFASCEDDEAEKVAFDKEYVDIAMSASVNSATLSGITLSDGENTVSTSAELLSDGKTIRVNILEDMMYGTEYTIDFSAVKDTQERNIETRKTTVTFTTEPTPKLYIPSAKIYNGVGAYAQEVQAFAADGAIYTVASSVMNTTTEESGQATLIYALYDSNGKLQDAAYVNKYVAAAKTEEIGTGITIPAALAGGTVKIFLLDSITPMQPYIKPFTFDIAE